VTRLLDRHFEHKTNIKSIFFEDKFKSIKIYLFKMKKAIDISKLPSIFSRLKNKLVKKKRAFYKFAIIKQRA